MKSAVQELAQKAATKEEVDRRIENEIIRLSNADKSSGHI